MMNSIGFARCEHEESVDDDLTEKSILVSGESEGAVIKELPDKPGPQMIGVFSDIDEETAAEIIHNLLIMKSVAESSGPDDLKPSVDFYISTNGGSAHEMFAIYDVMRMVKEHVDICTVGIGKVMSAGTLLLSAGTKGKRKIGKNCRVMIHDVIGGHVGPMNQLKNEMKEISFTQQQYAASLVAESSITEEYMEIILSRGVNSYISAEEALKMGLVDEIF